MGLRHLGQHARLAEGSNWWTANAGGDFVRLRVDELTRDLESTLNSKNPELDPFNKPQTMPNYGLVAQAHSKFSLSRHHV